MTKSYIVSGQGARFTDESYRVPPWVEIHFYFTRRKAPQIYKTRTVLEKFMVELGMFPDWVATAGEVVPVHLCWADPAQAAPSGVFRRRSGELSMDFAGSSPSLQVGLDYVVRELSREREQKMTCFHWMVRSEEATGHSSTRMRLAPRRLHAGMGEDVESQHAALAKL